MAQSKNPSTARSRYAEKIPPYNEHMHQVYEFATTRRVVRTGGGPKELTHYQVVMHKQLETALAGNSVAQRDILRQAELAVQSRDLFIQMQCEIWTAYKDLLQRGIDRARGTKAPPPSDLPHPADILVDWTKGVTILGPMDEAGRRRCEGLAKFRDALVVQQIMEDADNRVAMDNRPSTGAALVHAFLINTQLPPSFRLADAELGARVLSLLRLSKRESLVRCRAAWKAAGCQMPRGQHYGTLEKLKRMVCAQADLLNAVRRSDGDQLAWQSEFAAYVAALQEFAASAPKRKSIAVSIPQEAEALA